MCRTVPACLIYRDGDRAFPPPPESGRSARFFPQENLKPKQSKYHHVENPKIISIYLSYRQPRSTRKEFAEWFAAPFDGETKQRLMREYWDALSPRNVSGPGAEGICPRTGTHRVPECLAAVAAGCPSGVQKSGSHGGNDSYPRFGRCALCADRAYELRSQVAGNLRPLRSDPERGSGRRFADRHQFREQADLSRPVRRKGAAGVSLRRKLMPISPKIPSAVSCSRPTTSIFWCTAPRSGSVPM